MFGSSSNNNGGYGRNQKNRTNAKGKGKGKGKGGNNSSNNNRSVEAGAVTSLSLRDLDTLQIDRGMKQMLGSDFAIQVLLTTGGITIQVLARNDQGHFATVVGNIENLRAIASIHRELKDCDKDVQGPANRDSWKIMYTHRFSVFCTHDVGARQSPQKSLENSLQSEPARLATLKVLEHNFSHLDDYVTSYAADGSPSTELDKYALRYLRTMVRAAMGITNFEHVRASNLDKAHAEQRTLRELLLDYGIPKWLYAKLTTEKLALPPIRFLFRNKMASGLRLTLREIAPGSPVVKYLGILLARSFGQLALGHLLYCPIDGTVFISEDDLRANLTEHVKALDDTNVYINPPQLPSEDGYLSNYSRFDGTSAQSFELSADEVRNPITFITRLSLTMLGKSVGSTPDLTSVMGHWEALGIKDNYVVNSMNANALASSADKLKIYLENLYTIADTVFNPGLVCWKNTPIMKNFSDKEGSVKFLNKLMEGLVYPAPRRQIATVDAVVDYVSEKHPSVNWGTYNHSRSLRNFTVELAFLPACLQMTDCMVFETVTKAPPMLWKQIRGDKSYSGEELENFYKVPKGGKAGAQPFEARLLLIKSENLKHALKRAKASLDEAKVSTAGLARYATAMGQLKLPLQDVAASYVSSSFAGYALKNIADSAARADSSNSFVEEDDGAWD